MYWAESELPCEILEDESESEQIVIYTGLTIDDAGNLKEIE